jgi:hypothetical protein
LSKAVASTCAAECRTRSKSVIFGASLMEKKGNSSCAKGYGYATALSVAFCPRCGLMLLSWARVLSIPSSNLHPDGVLSVLGKGFLDHLPHGEPDPDRAPVDFPPDGQAGQEGPVVRLAPAAGAGVGILRRLLQRVHGRPAGIGGVDSRDQINPQCAISSSRSSMRSYREPETGLSLPMSSAVPKTRSGPAERARTVPFESTAN